MFSQQAYAKEEKTLKKQISKEFERAKIELGKLSHQDFDVNRMPMSNLKDGPFRTVQSRHFEANEIESEFS